MICYDDANRREFSMQIVSMHVLGQISGCAVPPRAATNNWRKAIAARRSCCSQIEKASHYRQ